MNVYYDNNDPYQKWFEYDFGLDHNNILYDEQIINMSKTLTLKTRTYSATILMALNACDISEYLKNERIKQIF